MDAEDDLTTQLRALAARIRDPGPRHYAPVGDDGTIDALRDACARLEWKPLPTAPRDGRFVELRGDSGYKSHPFRVMLARYNTELEKPGANSSSSYMRARGATTDEICWRTVAGDPCIEDGSMPTHWREAS